MMDQDQLMNYRQQLTSGGTGPSVGPIKATRAALGHQQPPSQYSSNN